MKHFYGTGFITDIRHMNETYELAKVVTTPQFVKRLGDFRVILGKEFAELTDISNKFMDLTPHEQTLIHPEAKVDLADLLGDIVVYCFSEAERHGIPMAEVLVAIMQSNATKLGKDGKPIKDENDKFLKGPNFVPPEPAIAHILGVAKKDPTVAAITVPLTAEQIAAVDDMAGLVLTPAQARMKLA